MKTLLLIVSLAILTSETCKKNKNAMSVPACIQAKIDSIKRLPRFNPPAELNEYIYNNKRVFLFSSDCCDRYNALFDENCNYLCAPTGGIAGKGDMKCTDFAENAKFVKLVWKDPR